MKIIFESGRYIVQSSFSEKDIPKGAGCRWSPDARVWWTDKPAIAAKLKQYMDPGALTELARSETQIEASKKTDADISIPCPEGLAYLPFQRAGIAYAAARPACLIADEMGLGKTIQALGVINSDETIRRALIICPASLRINWMREAEKWLTRSRSIQIITGKKPVDFTGEICIINYDIVSSHRAAIDAVPWDILIADEAHYLKGKSQRTAAVFGSRKKGKGPKPAIGSRKKGKEPKPAIAARKRILLTGTPIVNRPVELWNLVSYLNPSVFNNFFSYAKRYCNAQQNKYGWDFSGATNLDELQDSLRASVMVRRLKKNVLTELPAKRRQIIEVNGNGIVDAENRRTAEWEGRLNDLQARLELAEAADGDTTAIMADIADAKKTEFTEMAKARHDTAVAKIPACVEHITEVLESVDQVVVFVHHHDVANGLAAAFTAAGISYVTLTGEDSMEARQAAVDKFQAGNARIFIGSIAAAGVGITLIAAAHVIFCELPWTPAELSQAEDRCHRIGQAESVLVQHLVLSGSIDQRMAQALVEKQEIIDKALDIIVRKNLEAAPVIPTREKRASDRAAQMERIAAIITDDQVQAAHIAMKQLAGLDADFASGKNDIGFSKIDTMIGHELAERPALSKKQAALAVLIAKKYHRQIDLSVISNLFQEGK